MNALSVRQPHAEAIMRGVKIVECRGRPTATRGHIYIYAAHGRYDLLTERALMRTYGITDVDCDDLPRGVIVGTVDLYNAEGEQWYLRNPERARQLRKPKKQPQPVWFIPF